MYGIVHGAPPIILDAPITVLVQDSVPLALVDNTWPADPSADGSVHMTFEAMLSGALKPT